MSGASENTPNVGDIVQINRDPLNKRFANTAGHLGQIIESTQVATVYIPVAVPIEDLAIVCRMPPDGWGHRSVKGANGSPGPCPTCGVKRTHKGGGRDEHGEYDAWACDQCGGFARVYAGREGG